MFRGRRGSASLRSYVLYWNNLRSPGGGRGLVWPAGATKRVHEDIDVKDGGDSKDSCIQGTRASYNRKGRSSRGGRALREAQHAENRALLIKAIVSHSICKGGLGKW